MKIAAIIAEYNPLHEGHIYHMEQTRQRTGADYIITIMSGDYVQRGLPAVEEKFQRAEKALKAGSDLVLELPLPYALSSAEGFAFGGVSLAERLGCVDYLSFGLEDEKNLEAIKELARAMNAQDKSTCCSTSSSPDALADENVCPHFCDMIKNQLKEGLNYPAAVAHAAAAAFPEMDTHFLTEKGNSNTILALEYLRALARLDSLIIPAAVTRLGASHLETATALRAQLKAAESSDSPLLFPSDFSDLLHYKLLSLSYEDLLQYREMTPQLAHKIINSLPEYKDFEQFVNFLWTRDTTFSRVCRQFLYILLDIRKDTWDIHTQVPYARILGFRKSSSPLLRQIRESSSIPLISKLADASKVLTDDALSLLNLEVKASQIYDGVRYHKCGDRLPGEYQKQIVII